jgi:hypothetical protein
MASTGALVPVDLTLAGGTIHTLVSRRVYMVEHADGVRRPLTPGCSVVVRLRGQAIAHGRVAAASRAQPLTSPVTGVQLAQLDVEQVTLVANGWAAELRATRRSARGAADARWSRAWGQAKVLRAVAGDLGRGRPSVDDFGNATTEGLLVPRPLGVPIGREPAADAPAHSPLERCHDLAADVREAVARVRDHNDGSLRSSRVFAGITTAAALVLTGCSGQPDAGERRCTDSTGKVVDDDNCRTYGGGGSGGYFYRYGGSRYGTGGQTYVGGGSSTPPKGGLGFSSRSGGGG